MSTDPFASPIDPAKPLAPPAALSSPFMRIACRYCADGCLRAYADGPATEGEPFTRLPFEHAVAVQPDREDAPGYVAMDMRCGACDNPYTLVIHADGRTELRDA